MSSKLNSPKISGKTIEEVRRSAELAIQQLWNRVNTLVDETSRRSIGAVKQEDPTSGMRLIQNNGEYAIEAKFPDGWARVATTTTLLTKKD